MIGEHICEVCFRPVSEHDDPGFFPPRCCYGCPCGETMPAEFPEPLRLCPAREFSQR